MSEEIKQRIMDIVTNAKRKQKPGDVVKKLVAEMGVERSDVKKAIKELTSQDKLVFTYYGSSFIELPGGDQQGEDEVGEDES